MSSSEGENNGSHKQINLNDVYITQESVPYLCTNNFIALNNNNQNLWAAVGEEKPEFQILCA